MSLYGIASERSFCEQLAYNMLFKWFVGLELDESPFVPTTFTKNRDRFMKMDVGKKLFDAIVLEASERDLLSSEHFSVDGSLIEAAASMKSFRSKDDDDDQDGNGWADFTGKKRSNETHESTTDPESRLMRKGRGKEAKLSFNLNVLAENRNGIVVGIQTMIASGRSERIGAVELIDGTVAPMAAQSTLGADKGYDARPFFEQLIAREIRPHIATKHTDRKKPLLDGRTTNSRAYQLSQWLAQTPRPVAPIALDRDQEDKSPRPVLWCCAQSVAHRSSKRSIDGHSSRHRALGPWARAQR
jgi:IS5 family transposase